MLSRRFTAGILFCCSLALSSCGSPDSVPEGSSQGSSSAGTGASQSYNIGGFLGGNASPELPDGQPGQVSVVQIGPLDTEHKILIFAFRNNTSDEIRNIEWAGTARSGGAVVASGSSQGTSPTQVKPGEIGFSYIYFAAADSIPNDAEYQMEVSSTSAAPSVYDTAPMTVTEATMTGDAIVGSAVNKTGMATTGPFDVSIYCFEANTLVSHQSTFAEQGDKDIADGDEVTFSADLANQPCESFVVGVSGYFPNGNI